MCVFFFSKMVPVFNEFRLLLFTFFFAVFLVQLQVIAESPVNELELVAQNASLSSCLWLWFAFVGSLCVFNNFFEFTTPGSGLSAPSKAGAQRQTPHCYNFD